MAERTPSAFARARIAALCSDVLRRSGAAGVIPTPLDAIHGAVGIRECLYAPDHITERVLGGMWFEERILWVNPRQRLGRRRFTEAHELAHVICPWHEAVLRLDTAAELFGSAATGLEAEANFGAAELIFQGGRFAAEARGHDRSLRTAFALAERFGASRQAAAHQYVYGHEACVAVAIAGRWPGRDGALPVWHTVESPSFARRFGRLAAPIDTRDGAPFAAAVAEARCSSEPVDARVKLRDRGGTRRSFHAEVFNNRHCHLVFVAARTGRATSGRAQASAVLPDHSVRLQLAHDAIDGRRVDAELAADLRDGDARTLLHELDDTGAALGSDRSRAAGAAA
jgi:hypothetical protein